MHFVTPRILVMPFPTEELTPSLATYLNSAYDHKYMIYNLSEYTYDPDPFHSQVCDHSFSGFPNPPLEALFSICTSIKTWLDSDLGNIAVLHCQGKQVRCLMVLALFLVWTSPEFSEIFKAVKRLGVLLGCGEVQMQPSQSRYLQYSESVLQGVKVSDRQPLEVTLRLDRLIFTGIPITGARPYLQVFEGRELVFSSASQCLLPSGQIDTYQPSDLSFMFTVGVIVQGDVLVRCRHEGAQGTKTTLFRVMLNTAFVYEGVVRLEKTELDVACSDQGFPTECWADICFTPVESHPSVFIWDSFQVPKPKIHKATVKTESGSGTEDEEEEKVNAELLEKYRAELESSPSSEQEDLGEYLQELEARNTHQT